MTGLLLSVAAASLIALSASAGAQECPGDCNSDGTVTVDEIVLAVNIALGVQPPTECANADVDGNSAVEVDEIIAAVNAALCGCGEACPTPAPTAIPPTVTPTPGVDVADVVESIALSTHPGAATIAAFVIAGEGGAGFGAGGAPSVPCPEGGTMAPFCIDLGGMSNVTADLSDCAIQRGGVEIRATGRVAGIRPVGCGASLPPNASVSVSFSAVAISVTNLATNVTVNGVASFSGELRFRTDGSISTGFAGGVSGLCINSGTLRSLTFLVTPAGALCPTSGDLETRTRVTGSPDLITSLVRFSPQGASIDIGADGSIERTGVPCGPPGLVCP
jgi:hypothetical protein